MRASMASSPIIVVKTKQLTFEWKLFCIQTLIGVLLALLERYLCVEYEKKDVLMVSEIYQLGGSPQCEVTIIPHTVWSGSPIWSINLATITLRISVDAMNNI